MTSNREQRIVVTGLGATTPVGGNVTETWEAILAGESGVRLMPFDWVETYALPVKIAATIKQSPVDVLATVEPANPDPGQDVHGGLLDGRGDLHGELVGLDPVERHQAHARLAGEDRFPGLGDVAPDRGGRTQTCHDDALLAIRGHRGLLLVSLGPGARTGP